jgi:hypothetical protein
LTIPLDHTAQVVSLLVSKYLSRANYLRTSDGRPLVQLTDAQGIWNWKEGQATTPPDNLDFDSIAWFIHALRQESLSVLGKDIVLTLRMDDGNYRTLVERIGQHIDAGSCLVPILADTHEGIVAGLIDWMNTQAGGKTVMPCMPHDFDSRPRIGIMRDPDHISYLKSFNPASFARGMRKVKTWMDAHQGDELSQILTVYAWNEWHEGGVIEPNTRDQALYLNLISDIFQLPISADPCRISGACGGN